MLKGTKAELTVQFTTHELPSNDELIEQLNVTMMQIEMEHFEKNELKYDGTTYAFDFKLVNENEKSKLDKKETLDHLHEMWDHHFNAQKTAEALHNIAQQELNEYTSTNEKIESKKIQVLIATRDMQTCNKTKALGFKEAYGDMIFHVTGKLPKTNADGSRIK